MRSSTPALLYGLAILACASASKAGTLVVLNKSDATASLIDETSGRVAATLKTGQGPHEVAVSPDGTIAVATNYGSKGAPGSSLTVFSVPAAKVLRTIGLGEHTRPHGILWLPDGEHVMVTAEGSRSLLKIHVKSGRLIAAVGTGQKISHMVAATPDGKRAFVANIGSGSVTVIDLAAAKKLRDIKTGAGAEGIAATPDGREVWVTNRGEDTITVIDAQTLSIRKTISAAKFPIRAHITPNGRHVLVSNAHSGDLAVFSTDRHAETRRIVFTKKAGSTEDRLFGDRFGDSPVPIGIEIRPDSKRAWIAHTNADVIAVVNLETWRVEATLTAGREPDGLAYSPLQAGN